MNNQLMSKDRQTVKKIILYLFSNLGDSVEGKKKIMKLMFLLEHYDIKTGKLTPKQFLGNDFYIYYYGVFSQDVMDTVSELIQKGVIIDGFPLKSDSTSNIELGDDVKEKVDTIIDKFGKKSGYQLEVVTLKMLGIQPHEKSQYFGQDIGNILKQTKASS